MDTKVDIIKRKIEEMEKQVVFDKNTTVGDIAKNSIQENWVNNHVEAIINTVLAMRQKWKEAGEPRFEKYQEQFKQIDTLAQLDNLIKDKSEADFCKDVLGLNITKGDYWRYNMLCNMVNAFLGYQKEKGFSSDKEAMMDWARSCNLSKLENDPIGRLSNVGLATVQNLRMCLGIDTIKPDVHIISALTEIGLGNNVEICELISELTGRKCRELDQIFWNWGINSKKS